MQDTMGWVRKRLCLSHVCIETINLPRQARDKHKETLRQRRGGGCRRATGSTRIFLTSIPGSGAENAPL